ncbi:MAG: bifunctional folylpolyglutamate synthase/dihydrofolate synthase [Kordiimonadaceae bacterium]|jgi:dihydrofolate synthase / folylpolyglutamate synthase|nr:bifunctional folylpolyglutamate synthase/dihydrofolate synthase [Kordiimonadaceae bacterium]
MTMRRSDRILERLLSLHPKIIDLSLERMHDILDKLGNPQNNLPPVIHVAGTNGKGSTIAYLRAILESANLSVHVYTSPHLVRFNERIRLAGKIITEEYLQEILEYCENINDGIPITYFEITTAAALKAFADNPADVLLLEVGLGGRLDATNVVDQPLSTVLTPISIDHEQYLGNDLSVIAMEKASIAKNNIPLIFKNQNHIAVDSIMVTARNNGAITQNSWSFDERDSGFIYRDEFGTLDLPLPNLIGPHQLENSALAIATLRHQDKLKIDYENFAFGITHAKWPARMQNITDSAFGRMLPTGSELWLDGGHNPAAGDVIASSFKNDKLNIICGMMANKDTAGYLKPIASITENLFAVHVEGEASHSAEKIAEFGHSVGIPSQTSENVKGALENLSTKKPVKVLICGSLYLAGQVLDDNDLIPV